MFIFYHLYLAGNCRKEHKDLTHVLTAFLIIVNWVNYDCLSPGSPATLVILLIEWRKVPSAVSNVEELLSYIMFGYFDLALEM